MQKARKARELPVRLLDAPHPGKRNPMRRLHTILVVVTASLALGACDLVGDILEFGFWVFIILIALVILLGWGLVRALRREPRDRRPPPQ